ncbi:MAG: beta-ketoacyl-ACP synthase II [Desulfobacteraceae bacterium]|nr:beta-ketoacyl-ACP synthase II [Desulfobacteraceae bacterium]MBU4055605.1 beta-ketoacyl-ACP synthase II [Pseudomonadota bacterium]
MERRVVVTGLGLVTPLGTGVDKTWEALCAGKSGIGGITRFDATALDTRIAGEVRDFNPEDFLSKKEAKRTEHFIAYAVGASRMALEDSGFKITDANANRVGVVTGCGLGGLGLLESTFDTVMKKGPHRVSPFFIPMIIGNMAPGMISICLGAKGPNASLNTACAAGTHAICEAYGMIKHGHADAMITGGVESTITITAVAGFNAMKALSTRNDAPEKASRPFDKDRDGFVIAEGSGMMILEPLESALERGAHIYAEVLGFGMSGDGFNMTAPAPEGEGAARCMEAALKNAGIEPSRVDYINAHGTSTEIGDLYETQAIKQVFKDHAKKVLISSTKSMTGHLLGAAGGVEGIFSVLAIEKGIIPPTINLDTPDEACDLDYVPNVARKAEVNVAMSNSFGFGGTNGTVIFGKYHP